MAQLVSWIGPTSPPGATPPIINNTGWNLSVQALFGNDPVNSTVDNLNPSAFIGALTNPYLPIGPMFLLIVGCVVAMVIYIKNGGDLAIPSIILIGTGMLSGFSNITIGTPIVWMLFPAFCVGLGLFAILYQILVGR